MKWTKYRLMLAVLMVITGTLNTLVSKWTNTEKAVNSIGITESFSHPYLQSTGYFFGNFMCLIVFYAYVLFTTILRCLTKEQKSEKSAESRREIQEVVVIDNTVEADEEDEDASSTPMKPVNVKRTVFNKKIEDVDEDEEDDSENDYFSTTSFESGNISSDSEAAVVYGKDDGDTKMTHFTWKSCWLFLFPAICDVTATSAMYVGLNLTSASSYQMLRGSVIIFTGLASRFFLRKKLNWYKWLGMFVILGGLFVVGCADLFSADECGVVPTGNGTNSGNDDDAFILEQATKRKCDEKKKHSIMGDAILVSAQIVVAVQGTYEENILKRYDVAPIEAIGWEGFFGFTILSTLLVAMKHIGTGSKTWGHSPLPPFYLEDAYDGLVQLQNNLAMLGAFFGVIVSICIFNVVGIGVTQEMSATTRMVLDSVRTIFIWIIALGLGWQDFHILQPLGFLCIIVGMCFYYNLLIVPYGRKLWQLFQDHQNSKKKINPTSPPPPGTQLPPGEPTEVVSQKTTTAEKQPSLLTQDTWQPQL